MRDFIDHNDVANTVMMLRSGFKGIVVIVEGNTDDRLYGKFLDPDGAGVVVAQSKSNVKKALREITARGDGRAIGIVDSDLDIALRKSIGPPLFRTDGRDLESMLFFSSALGSLLAEYADRDSLRRFTERYGDIRDIVCKACYHLGLLMLVSEKKDLGLRFKDPDFGAFIDRRTLQCDVRALVRSVIGASDVRIDPSSLIRMLKDEGDHSYREICRGHDIAEIAAIGLRNIFGGYNTKGITGNTVAGGLRLSFTPDDLRATDLYRDTADWAASQGLSLWKV